MKKSWLSSLIALLCATSLLFGCSHNQPTNSEQSSESITSSDSSSTNENTDSSVNSESTDSSDTADSSNPDSTDSSNSDSSDSADSSDSDSSSGTSDSSDSGNEDDGNDDNENDKIDLPDNYVITMSDMERFLLTKDEQYPITNEYVEIYQQASGGYIANALKAGLVVDKAQHLPSQKWHYFESWLYTTIDEGMLWDASASDRSYGKFSCPELLLWIIEATGVDSAKVREAKDIAMEGKQNGVGVSTICASIRSAIPFNTYLRPIIIEWLENNPYTYPAYKLTVNTDSAYTLTSIKDTYNERETVSFSVLMTDNTKEITKVTVNDNVLEASNGTTYKFSMLGEDVNVVITVNDKSVVPPQIEATKDYYYDVVYQLPGKTAVSFKTPAEAYNVIQFHGTQTNILSSVSSITNVYGGGRGGSGDTIWYAGNMLKLGTTSVTGSITLELTQKVKGVIITGYVTNNGCIIRVGDSSSTIWTGNGDDGKTTSVTAKDAYFMNVAGKESVEANATSTIQINFESTNSVTISTEKNGSKFYVLYITAIEFIVE